MMMIQWWDTQYVLGSGLFFLSNYNDLHFTRSLSNVFGARTHTHGWSLRLALQKRLSLSVEAAGVQPALLWLHTPAYFCTHLPKSGLLAVTSATGPKQIINHTSQAKQPAFLLPIGDNKQTNKQRLERSMDNCWYANKIYNWGIINRLRPIEGFLFCDAQKIYTQYCKPKRLKPTIRRTRRNLIH